MFVMVVEPLVTQRLSNRQITTWCYVCGGYSILWFYREEFSDKVGGEIRNGFHVFRFVENIFGSQLFHSVSDLSLAVAVDHRASKEE